MHRMKVGLVAAVILAAITAASFVGITASLREANQQNV